MRAGTLRAASAILLFLFVFLSIFHTRSSQSLSIHKRALVDDDAWQKAVNIGTELADPQCEDVESVFTDWTALADNGYRERNTGELEEDLKPAFHALGFSTSNNDNRLFMAQQIYEGNTRNDYGQQRAGFHYEDTEGFFFNMYNARDGVIVATDNNSPSKAGEAKGKKAPPLQRWSDVTGLIWRNFAQDQASNLKYIFRWHVKEVASQAIFDRILSNMNPPIAKDKIPNWPGFEFKIDDDIAKALVSTPNGRGVARFLSQHRQAFGHKKIVSVNLFLGEEGYDSTAVLPTLAFKIGSV